MDHLAIARQQQFGLNLRYRDQAKTLRQHPAFRSIGRQSQHAAIDRAGIDHPAKFWFISRAHRLKSPAST